MKTKVLTLLGFAAKAGKLNYGFEATIGSLKLKKSSLVLTANDLSPKSLKEIKYFTDKFGVAHISLEGTDMKTLSDAVGRKCGIVSVNEKGFAESILNTLNPEIREGDIANDK